MSELQSAIQQLKSIIQKDDLHAAEEAFQRMYFRFKGKFPSSISGTTYSRFLHDLIKDTVAVVKPGLENYLTDKLDMHQNEGSHFFWGTYFVKSDFITFFYFADLDKGALTFSRPRKAFQYVPLSLRDLQSGAVPEMREIDVFGPGALFDQERPSGPPPALTEMDKKIEKHKRLTKEGKSLSEIFNKFFDLTEANPDYFMDGEQENDEFIAQMVGNTVGQMVGKSGFVMLDQVMMINMPRHSLVHGNCICLNRMVAFFFFKDIGVGVLATMGGSDQYKFARMTAIPLGPSKDGPYFPPPSSKLSMN